MFVLHLWKKIALLPFHFVFSPKTSEKKVKRVDFQCDLTYAEIQRKLTRVGPRHRPVVRRPRTRYGPNFFFKEGEYIEIFDFCGYV